MSSSTVSFSSLSKAARNWFGSAVRAPPPDDIGIPSNLSAELPSTSGSTITRTRQSLDYGGEQYRRTKRGNLISRSRFEAPTRAHTDHRNRRAEQAKKPCRYYTKTGAFRRPRYPPQDPFHPIAFHLLTLTNQAAATVLSRVRTSTTHRGWPSATNTCAAPAPTRPRAARCLNPHLRTTHPPACTSR